MFDFEKLDVFKKSRDFNKIIREKVLKVVSLDPSTKSQLSRAAYSIMLNIAEGSGRFTKRDKRNFYIISRGSLFETIAICGFLNHEDEISADLYAEIYSKAEEISKILFTMIKNLS